ncbi:hypothetical protein HRR83_008467 [Exophiala dermatitidis]|uniref:Nucleoside-diphosphate-sugar epimerase n=1 Tax=Exophiala dermatitidis TaxID=5970 RepID=A0AAN6ENB8_EXODE|nr:hypothetical protein HRR75_007681 [Exophiala dermatitidis]KAJ4505952.1 hypothetical protein HRR73_008282 [Exophiala dermatitidis]KAJ4506462.1 hypothetical protein HRR74_008360 [Exophiala dermatitidis]KAJ4533639.1 hypothetical protein HRR77_008400 [Exophiala dermatitidis]KAJ4539325.1 hypothetical protein HRR78_007805 [Exophiala dermatitidis]
MVHLILTGATGLVGSSVLSHILSLPTGGDITRLSILTRNSTIPLLANPPPPGTPNANRTTEIEVIQHGDFARYPKELLARLEGADACIWALGVSQMDVDRGTYVRITRDFAIEAAKAFSGLKRSEREKDSSSSTTTAGGHGQGQHNDGDDVAKDDSKFKFSYVSGRGATTQNPKPWTPFFAHVKGETEAALLALSKTEPYASSLAVYSVRPAAVDGYNQPWLWREILSTHRTALQRIYLSAAMVPLRWAARIGLARGLHSPTEELGRVLVEMAVDDSRGPYRGSEPDVTGEGRILENSVVRRMAKIHRKE